MHKLASARSEGNHAGEANKKKSIRFVVSTPRAHIKKDEIKTERGVTCVLPTVKDSIKSKLHQRSTKSYRLTCRTSTLLYTSITFFTSSDFITG